MIVATVSTACLALLAAATPLAAPAPPTAPASPAAPGSPGEPCPGVGKLAVTSGDILDFYGESVTITGAWAAASSVFVDFGPGPEAGILDLWRDGPDGWELHDQLQPFELPDVDRFGRGLASDGELIALQGWDELGPGSGIARVVVLRRSGLVWSVDAILSSGVVSSPGVPSDGYGTSIALHGDRMAIGAPQADVVEHQQGLVHTYRHDGASWVSTGVLSIPGGAAIDRFGRGLAMSSSHLAAAAPNVDNPAGYDGALYLFELVDDAWVLRDQTDPLGPGAPDGEFGETLVMSAATVAVGAPQPTGSATASGSVHIYRRSGNDLLDDGLLDGASEGHFGRTGAGLDLSAGRLLVGSPSSSDGGGAFVYTKQVTGWTLQQSLAPCFFNVGDGFGEGLALEGSRMLVGAPGDDGDTTQSQAYGVLHAFELDGAQFVNTEELMLGAEASASRGGPVRYYLWPGSTAPGATYVMLGSISGTTPGVSIQGFEIPLNVDAWFELLLGFPAGGIFFGFNGAFPDDVPTKATLILPAGLPPVLVGLRFDHAWLEVVGNQIQSVSEAEGFVFDL